ncbi:hypothetical protein VNI00_005975 [Paramarasmius palmivorus]|uniref:Uncharacterized protein n=1 Tax=Paramarasmius palmivorus TaxID=297713 RepID=A0AAW0DF36_9AGAR
MPKVPSQRQSPHKATQQRIQTSRDDREIAKRQREEEKRIKQDQLNRKKHWRKYVTDHQWSGKPAHKHKKGTKTLCKTKAAELDVLGTKLTSNELGILKYEIRTFNPPGMFFLAKKKLYSKSDVVELAKLKAQTLGVTGAPSSNPGSNDNEDKTIKKHEYESVPGDPPADEIIWKGEHLWYFDVNIKDACLTYCLKPKDLTDLVSKEGRLDLQSVAVRALEVHGGLKRHNGIVIQRRKGDQEALEVLGHHEPLQPYSQELRELLEQEYGQNSWAYNIGNSPPRPTQEERRRTVLQYGPVYKLRVEYYGSDWMWFHGNGRPLMRSTAAVAVTKLQGSRAKLFFPFLVTAISSKKQVKMPPESSSRRKATNPSSKTAQQKLEAEQRRKERDAKKQQRDEEKLRKAEERKEKARRKEAWEDYVKENQWSSNGEDYTHPNQLWTINKGNAMKLTKPQLKSEEVNTLPHEFHLLPALEGEDFERPMKLYALGAVYDLAKLRATMLGVELQFASPGVSRYSKLGLVVKHKYTPPANASPEDPSPDQILWKGEHLWGYAVNAKDACLTYCLHPGDISDLKSEYDWFDLQSVAVRALEIHGGLQRHNEMIIAKRKADIESIEKLIETSSYDGKPLENYSKKLRDFLPRCKKQWSEDLDDALELTSSELRQRRVLQYGPVFKRPDEERAEWVWFHGNRLPLEEKDLNL